MKKIRRSIAITLLLFSGIAAFATEPEEIRYLTEDYAPSNFIDNGKLTGLAVELLRLMWARMGVEEQNIHVYPWPRGYSMVQTEPNVMLFAMTRSAEREGLFKWVGPIYGGNYTLYSVGAKPLAVRRLEDAKRLRVGVIRAEFTEKDLLARGFPPENLISMETVPQLTKMLFMGRIDLLYLYDGTLRAYLPKMNATEADFYPSFVVSENRLYYAFNKSVDDALIARFQAALNSLDSQRREIARRYGVSP